MLAARLKEIRKLKGLFQKELAKRINITQQAYLQLEKSQCPRLDTVIRLCELMDVEVSFLFAFDIPVTKENLRIYGKKKYTELVLEHKNLHLENKKLKQQIEFFNNVNKTDARHIHIEKPVYLPMAVGQ